MGRFGAWLVRQPVGHVLEAGAPRGRFVLDRTGTDRLLLLGAGSGVAPFRAFLEAWRSEPGGSDLVLLQSAQRSAELVFHEELARQAAVGRGFRWVPTVTRAAPDDAWTGRRGRIDAALLCDHLVEAERTRVYVCGPEAFVKAMLALAGAQRVPPHRPHHEAWG